METVSQPWMIRGELLGDEAGIDTVHRRCFPTFAEAQLVRDLRSAYRLTISIAAVIGNEIVGHVAFSPVVTENGSNGLGLAPVAVLDDHRCRGIAAELIRAGLQVGRSRSFPWCVVLGEPAYYSRFGFRPAPALGLTDEYGGGDAFQVLELLPGSLPTGAGQVRYAPEFAVFS